jgi:hypothetical protein
VPDRETVCVVELALSVTVIAAVNVPAEVGTKLAWIAQLPPAGTFDPQLFVIA